MILDDIFMDICERVRADGDLRKSIHVIDWFNGQPERWARQNNIEGLRLPCLLVEWERPEWRPRGRRKYMADGLVHLHLVRQQVDDPMATDRDPALVATTRESYALIQHLVSVVRGMRGTHYGTFGLVDFQPDHDYDLFRVDVASFRSHLVSDLDLRSFETVRRPPLLVTGHVPMPAEPGECPTVQQLIPITAVQVIADSLTAPQVEALRLLICTACETLEELVLAATPAQLFAVMTTEQREYVAAQMPLPENELHQYTSSATWTKPSSPRFAGAMVLAVGAAGAGGSSQSASNSGSQGGGSPAVVRRWLAAADLAATESVIVGAGGTSVLQQVGGGGGDSMFGAHVLAKGGGGGARGQNGSGSAETSNGANEADCVPRAPYTVPGQMGGRGNSSNTTNGGGRHGNQGLEITPSGGGGRGSQSAGFSGGGLYVAGVFVPGGVGGAVGSNGSNGTSDVLTDLLHGIAVPSIGIGTAGGGGGSSAPGQDAGEGGAGGRAAPGGGSGAPASTGVAKLGGAGGHGYVIIYNVYR